VCVKMIEYLSVLPLFLVLLVDLLFSLSSTFFFRLVIGPFICVGTLNDTRVDGISSVHS
jgi:hypothetical protein